METKMTCPDCGKSTWHKCRDFWWSKNHFEVIRSVAKKCIESIHFEKENIIEETSGMIEQVWAISQDLAENDFEKL